MSAKARSRSSAATGAILACGVTAVLNWPGTASATPSKDFVNVVRNTVAPGGYSGWHTHPSG